MMADLYIPPKPAIIRATELPRSPAEARGIALKKAFGPAPVFVAAGAMAQRKRVIDLINTANPTPSTANSDTHIFNGVAIGNPHSSRIILAPVTTYFNTITNGVVSEVTIGGGAASLISDGTTNARASHFSGGVSNVLVEWWGIRQSNMSSPTATSVTITVVTSSAIGSNRHLAIGAYRMLHASGLTALDVTVATNADPLSLSLDTANNGAALAAVQYTGATSHSWNGLSRDHDIDTASATGTDLGWASVLTATAETPRTVSVDDSGSPTRSAAVSISFAPL